MYRSLLLLFALAITLASCDSNEKQQRHQKGLASESTPDSGSSETTLPSVASSAQRIALVIGCNRYANLSEGKQLTSPVADAIDVAAMLKSLGYTLVTGAAVTDAGRDTIVTATENFAAQASGADAAVFYFSGHGIQVGDDNFLMPSDSPKLSSYSVLKNRGIQLRETVMVALEEAQAKTKVIILDCCRENPFADQVDEALGKLGKSMRTKGGLGEISGYGPGFFLAFATSPGTLADDGNGQRNSPFTAALLTHLQASAAEDITPLFRRVKATVRERSGQAQVPWTNDSLDASFVFAPGAISDPILNVAPAAVTSSVGSNNTGGWRSAPGSEPKAGDTWEIALTRGEKITFSYCPAGSFDMGSPPGEEDRGLDEDQVTVRFTKGFWMAQTECSQGQWEAIIETKTSNLQGSKKLPMKMVSWDETQELLTKLIQTPTLTTAWKFALPSEAQWEYACRAGTQTPFSFGKTLSSLQANFDRNQPNSDGIDEPYVEMTVETGSYAPNAWGLYDMHGNVAEWCSDRYIGSRTAGATRSIYRAFRGGSWSSSADSCRAAFRNFNEPGYRSHRVGVRLALVPSGP